MMKLRKIACHQIVFEDSTSQKMQLVELDDGVVMRCYPLKGEQPQTEWMSGSIYLRHDKMGLLRAFYENKELK